MKHTYEVNADEGTEGTSGSSGAPKTNAPGTSGSPGEQLDVDKGNVGDFRPDQLR